MLKFVTPHMQLNSVLDLDLETLRGRGIQGLLLDVDGTLKDHPAKEFGAEIHRWIDSMRNGGVRLCLFSNGRPPRIGGLARQLDIPYVAQAFKPAPLRCRRGLETLGVKVEEAAVVGDQIFADVLAGRLAGLYTILVRPTSLEEPWFTRLKRPPERWLLGWLNGRARRA